MMNDERFRQSIIYILEHDKDGATGIVLNKKLGHVTLSDLFDKTKDEDQNNAKGNAKDSPELDVHFGGPIDTERGFFLHTHDVSFENSLYKTESLHVTATQDILQSIANDTGPKHMIFALGYAGWEAGQLDQELRSDSWLVCTPDKKLIFETSLEKKWQAAMDKMGIDLSHLSQKQGLA